MKEFLKKLFITETGDFRTLPSIAWFGVLTVIGIVALGPEILYGFSDRFWRAGIFQLLGPIAGAIVAYKAVSYYNKTQNAKGLLSYIGVGIVLFWAGLFGSAVGLKIDRSDSIPDVAIYWANGKVKNPTDSTKKDYYFDYVELSELDSLYVVEHGEEPGYNKNNAGVRSGAYPKSDKPRANEDWQKSVIK